MASCHRHITVATFRLHDAITNNNLGLITVCYDGTMISWSADITFWHRCKFKHSASWYSTDVKKKQCDETAVTMAGLVIRNGILEEHFMGTCCYFVAKCQNSFQADCCYFWQCKQPFGREIRCFTSSQFKHCFVMMRSKNRKTIVAIEVHKVDDVL